MSLSYDDICDEAAATGLLVRGITPKIEGRFLILLGNAGPQMWQHFEKALPTLTPDNPLDTWTRSVGETLARHWGGRALFPFEGPPFHPFQRWAMLVEPVFPSPIGPLIHPRYGLWHAYRAAIAVADPPTGTPARQTGESPCESCPDKPCLSACKVDSFSRDGYDVPACVSHLRSKEGALCMTGGCLARHACPIGQEYAYIEAQAAFHMTKFLAAQPNPKEQT